MNQPARRRNSRGPWVTFGGFEVCGDLVYSEPDTRSQFDAASAELARRVIAAVQPAGA